MASDLIDGIDLKKSYMYKRRIIKEIKLNAKRGLNSIGVNLTIDDARFKRHILLWLREHGYVVNETNKEWGAYRVCW